MKAQPSQDLPENVTLFEEEMGDLEAWTPLDLDPYSRLGGPLTTDLAE